MSEGDPVGRSRAGVRFGFVVLNFVNYDDTIACVKSILKVNAVENYPIVVVDNASQNDSFSHLQREFRNTPCVNILLNESNGGYSVGNNRGIRFLREIGVENVIIATNDTEVISDNFLCALGSVNLTGVGVVGFDVITPNGEHQNPSMSELTLLYILNLHFYEATKKIRGFLYRFFPALERRRKLFVAEAIHKLTEESGARKGARKVYMLHGCFLVLTGNYISTIGLLDEGLFMYGEEDLISWACHQRGLIRLYLPEVSVLHKDAKATKTVHGSNREKFVSEKISLSKMYLSQRIRLWPLMITLLRGVRN